MGNDRVTWNKAWYHPTESIYGIACKLSSANCVSIGDALAYLGRSVPVPVFEWNWYPPAIIGKSDLSKADNASVVWPSAYNPLYSFSVRYCPECLGHAFHSVTHQNRLVQICPVHGLKIQELCSRCGGIVLPTYGGPWQCSSCQNPLAQWEKARWLHDYRDYPGNSPAVWTEAEDAAFFKTNNTLRLYASGPHLLANDYTYWNTNWRKLGVWYFNELLSLLRETFGNHERCICQAHSASVLNGALADKCPVQLAFFWVAEKIWPNGYLWEFPVLGEAIKKGIHCFLVNHLFDKQSARYLTDAPAGIVVRDLAKANFASALENCLAGDFRSLGFHDAEIEPRRYETTWRLDGEMFELTPAISRAMFKKLSDAATLQCKRRVLPANLPKP